MSTEVEELDETAENDGSGAVQDHADELEDQDDPPTYGERNRDLPDQLKQAIKNALIDIGKQEMFDRRREVMRDRRNRYYRRGFQHIYTDSKNGGFVQGQAGQSITVGQNTIECPNYIGDYNIYRPTLLVIESVLCQNPPGIEGLPDDPSNPEDMEAAQTFEAYKEFFNRANDVKNIQLECVEMFGNSGRTIAWVRTEANEQLWGRNDDGEPKQNEVCTIHGTLESKVPIMAKSKQDCMYCILFDDPQVKMAKRQYPHIEDEIKSSDAGICESSYERIARLGVLQGTRKYAQVGEAMSHLVTRANAFLRPSNFTGKAYDDPFEEADGPDDFDPKTKAPLSVRKKLEQLFPQGCHAVYLGETYAESWDESMDDHLEIGFPYEGDGMSREAMMDDAVIIQDFVNDIMNGVREAQDLGWPRTFINGEEEEFDAIIDQKSEPYAFGLKKARESMALGDDFFREPDLVIPPSLTALMEYLAGPFLQFVLGTPPALFGGGMKDQTTANGYAQARAQAMGVKGIPWQSLQWMFARIYYMAALAASKNPDHAEEIVVPGKGGQNQTLTLEKLRKGNFGVYPDEDSSFPESTDAKRAQLTELLTIAQANPAVGEQIMSSPDNWELFKEMKGFAELDIPEAAARNKQVREIELLLAQSPIQPTPEELQAAQAAHAAAVLVAQQQAAQTGSPAPPPPPFDPTVLLKTSVMPEEDDFHAWEAKKCQDWLTSDKCWQAMANPPETADGAQEPMVPITGHPGILNIRLHRKAHMAMLAAQGPPPGAPILPGKPPMPPPPTPVTSAPPGAPGAPTM